jgi:hypothetical protein
MLAYLKCGKILLTVLSIFMNILQFVVIYYSKIDLINFCVLLLVLFDKFWIIIQKP